MATLEQENAKLELLRQHFASDEHIKDRAERHRGQTPEQGLAEVVSCCEMADWFLAHRDPRSRELPPEELPADTLELLERLQQR